MAEGVKSLPKPNVDQQWREWTVRHVVQCYRGDDPRKLIEMADALQTWARGGYVASGCDFCGKSKDVVAKLVAGPRSSICDECLKLSTDILAADEKSAQAEAPPSADGDVSSDKANGGEET